MPNTSYHSSSISLAGDLNMTDGLAVEMDDGTFTGHVTIYTSGGSLTISSKDVGHLDALADAIRNAASLLDAAQDDKLMNAAAGAA